MPVGTPIALGFYPTTQRPVDERYLNNGTAWVDEAEVLAGIATASRYIGLTVLIGSDEYWFTDLNTLALKNNIADAENVSIADAGDLFVSDNAEDALQEVKAIADDNATAIETLKVNPYQMNLPAGNLATKVAGATFTPTGWATVAVDNAVNALLTHTLTDRKPVLVKVWEIDGANERLTKDFEDAFSGILATSTTVNVEGINPTALALRVEFIFD
jgi:hypothetical protein